MYLSLWEQRPARALSSSPPWFGDNKQTRARETTRTHPPNAPALARAPTHPQTAHTQPAPTRQAQGRGAQHGRLYGLRRGDGQVCVQPRAARRVLVHRRLRLVRAACCCVCCVLLRVLCVLCCVAADDRRTHLPTPPTPLPPLSLTHTHTHPTIPTAKKTPTHTHPHPPPNQQKTTPTTTNNY